MATGPTFSGHDHLRPSWVVFLVVGILLIVLGVISLNLQFFTTLLVILIYGWSLLIAAVLHVVALFYSRRWEGLFLHLIAAVLALIVGLFMVTHPEKTAVGLTLAVAILLIAGGLFRAITSLFLQFPNWGWSVLSGLIALLLGTAVWRQWPYDGLVFFGICVGVDFIVQGWSLVMFALVLRKPGSVRGAI